MTQPAMDERGLTQQFIERLAKEAGGEEHGPRTWNMTFNRDALHRFADSIAKFCESAYLAATARDGTSAGLCPRCAGTGRDPSTTSLQCSKCMGQGAVVIRASLKAMPEVEVVDAFEICAKVAEGHADLVEEMRGIYPGDPHGALGRDANKMRELAKAIRALRPQPSPDADGDAA